MTGQKRGPPSKHILFGVFLNLTQLLSLPSRCLPPTPLQTLLFPSSTSLISTNPHLSPHSLFFFFNMNCDCPALCAHWKQSACSSLIGWAPSDLLIPPLLLQQVGRSMAAHDPSHWCLPVQAKRQIYPETMAPRTFSLYRLICVSLSIWIHRSMP